MNSLTGIGKFAPNSIEAADATLCLSEDQIHQTYSQGEKEQ